MRGRKKVNEPENLQISSALEVILEYSKRCTLDGIKYIGDRTRHWTERCYLIHFFFSLQRIYLDFSGSSF